MKPQSLRSLERELAFTLLGFLEHETSLANERGFGANAGELLEIKQALESRLGRRAVTQPLESVAYLLEKRRTEVRETCRQSLVRTLGELVERHNATCGWVFLYSPDNRNSSSYDAQNGQERSGMLMAVASYNAPSPTRIYSTLQSKGIVSYVARTGDAYLVDTDCSMDPHYVPLVANSVSEVAVPIFAQPRGFAGGPVQLLGVINLEANYPYAFGTAVPLQLLAQSTAFTLDLLCMKAIQERTLAGFWHPSIHGWSFRNVLDAYCSAIAEALPTETGTASLACAAWYNDKNKGRLFVRGTAGFDFEYVKDRTLSTDSAIGKACDAFEQGVWNRSYLQGHELVLDIPEFRRRAKAKRMEMRSVGIFPFSMEPLGAISSQTSDPISRTRVTTARSARVEAGGALVFYGFEHQYGLEGISVPQLLNANVGERLARQFSNLVDQLRDQRLHVARCRIDSQLKTELTAARNPFETIVRALKDIFDADGVSIFTVQPSLPNGQEPNYKYLRVRATTGLISAIRGTQSPSEDVYRVENFASNSQIREIPQSPMPGAPRIQVHIGLTNFLAKHPNTVIRKNDVLDIQEPVIPVTYLQDRLHNGTPLYFYPQNILLESHAPGAGEHMRFVGASVGAEEGMDTVYGVIRITRASTRAPFTVADEELLGGLLPTMREVFKASSTDAITLADSISQASELRDSIAELIELNRGNKERMGDAIGRAFNRRFGHTSLDQLMSSIEGVLHTVRVIEKADDNLQHAGELKRQLGDLLQTKDKETASVWNKTRKRMSKLIQNWRGTANVSLATNFIQRLQARKPHKLVSADCDLSALLEDTAQTCGQLARIGIPTNESDAVVLTCLRFLQKQSNGEDSLRVVSVYPSWSKEPGEEDLGEAIPRARNQPANGWTAIDKLMPTTFRCLPGEVSQHKHRVHPLTSWVVYGALTPFQTFSLGRTLNGVISVDFAEELPRNSEFEKAVLKALALAASKCLWILAASELSLMQQPVPQSIAAWSYEVRAVFRRFTSPNRRARFVPKAITLPPQDPISSAVCRDYVVQLDPAVHSLFDELLKLGCIIKSEKGQFIWHIPLWTINGVYQKLVLVFDRSKTPEEFRLFLWSIRRSILQYSVIAHNNAISRNAYLRNEFVLDHTVDDIDFWKFLPIVAKDRS